MRLILNIGLNVNDGSALEALEVEHTLMDFDFAIGERAIVHSDSEQTLVIEAWSFHPNMGRAIADLSVALKQDCIASYSEREGKGWLDGPAAGKWGPFNPSFFFKLDGQRLAPVAA